MEVPCCSILLYIPEGANENKKTVQVMGSPNNFEPLYFIWLKTAQFFYLYGDRYIHRHRIPAKQSHHLYNA